MKCRTIENVLDWAIQLAFFAGMGYQVIGVLPNGVILSRNGMNIGITT